MPRNPPRPNGIDGLRPMRRFGVYVSSDSTTQPTEEDEKKDLHVLRISRGAGDRLSTAEIAVDRGAMSGRPQRPIQDEKLSAEMNRRVEIWLLKENVREFPRARVSHRERCVFAGEIINRQMAIRDGEERYILTAAVMPYHFGQVAHGMEVWSYASDNTVVVPHDLEWQPMIDGIVLDNMVPAAGDEEPGDTNTNPNDYAIWVDPESVRTTTAQDEYHSTPQPWTLDEIIRTMCTTCNSAEDFIRNPDMDDVRTAFEFLEHPPLIANLVQRRGGWLSDYLSGILPRYTFNWFLSHKPSDDDEEVNETHIVIYQRGVGLDKPLKLQRFGQTLDESKSTVTALDVGYNTATLANKVYVYGARKEREVTLPLYPGWDMSAASLDESDVDNPAGRMWLASEAGDIKGLNASYDAGDPPDIFDNHTIPRRRVMEDCLTYLSGETTRRPPFVEYSTDDGVTWYPLDNLETPYRMMPDRIGIYFTAASDEAGIIPSELHETDSALLKLRITGTVRDDHRISYAPDRDERSPNGLEVVKLIDASDQFFDRQRQSAGAFASVLGGAADIRDDTELIEDYAESIATSEAAAQVTASFTIPGFSFEFEIGDIIEEVEGRTISFNRRVETEDEPSALEYLQVVEITYDNVGQQRTTITVEAYDT